MNKFIITIMCLFTFNSQAANYRVINEDHLLDSDKVTITFSQRIDKTEGKVTFRTCAQCQWQTRPFDQNTELYIKEGKVKFKAFKKAVLQSKNNANDKEQLVLISMDSRKGKEGVFSLHWNYKQH